jgi:hypothetical protein
MKMPPMLECEKLSAAAPVSRRIEEFLDWLETQGIQLGKHVAVLDPASRYVVVECPSCSEDCWRIEDVLSLSINPHLDRHHHETEEEAHHVAAGLEDDRLAKAQEDPAFQPFRRSREKLLADYLGVDLDKVEQERRALLSALGKTQS